MGRYGARIRLGLRRRRNCFARQGLLAGGHDRQPAGLVSGKRPSRARFFRFPAAVPANRALVRHALAASVHFARGGSGGRACACQAYRRLSSALERVSRLARAGQRAACASHRRPTGLSLPSHPAYFSPDSHLIRTPHAKHLTAERLDLSAGRSAGRARRQASRAGRGARLSAGRHCDRPLGSGLDQPGGRHPAHFGIRRRAAAVSDRTGARTEAAVVHARPDLRLGRRASGGRDGGIVRSRAGARSGLENGADRRAQPDAVLDRHRAGDAGRAQPAGHAGRHGRQGALLAVDVIVALIAGGRTLLRPILLIIAKTDLREIFTAFALLLLIATGLLMQSIGMSMALGTFLAGVLLADSEYRTALETDLEPFKGLLLGLFFTAVGMSVDFGVFLARPALILGLVAGFLLIKGAVLLLLARMFAIPRDQRTLFVLLLAQGGEFAFVVFGAAATARVFTQEPASMQ